MADITNMDPATTPSAESTNMKQEQPALKGPSSVPFYDENYTWSDRERDLALMQNLLLSKLEHVNMELGITRMCIHNNLYGVKEQG